MVAVAESGERYDRWRRGTALLGRTALLAEGAQRSGRDVARFGARGGLTLSRHVESTAAASVSASDIRRLTIVIRVSFYGLTVAHHTGRGRDHTGTITRDGRVKRDEEL